MEIDRARPRLRTLPHRLWRRVLARRRLLAAVLAAVAVASGVRAATTPAPEPDPVVVAAHDLAAGSVLEAGDLTTRGFAHGTAPAGAFAAAAPVLGQRLAAPVRTGEPVTDVRLLGAELTATEPGLVAVPVRLPDAAGVALLEPGDRIDLVGTDPEGRGSHVVARDVPVLAVPFPPDPAEASATMGGGAQSGALVVLGVASAAVPTVADAGVRYFLTYAFSG